jgi:hypothetical protein
MVLVPTLGSMLAGTEEQGEARTTAATNGWDSRAATSYRSTSLRKPVGIGPGSPWQMNAPQ